MSADGTRAQDVVEEHAAAGREFTAGGVRSFVRDEGTGDPVVCLHGVPTSSFLYRKVLAELARSRTPTPEKGELYRRVLSEAPYPVGLLWGADDPSLRPSREGEQIRVAIGAPAVPTLPGKHFLPEEQPAAIAEHVAALARR